ncbi:MAG: precorrin-6y C5,15-methyltransferase (decarboxylating) subunit CbiE [Desulfarculaceae bacterium]|nr:precorrin-6y C5,15-methyltransferase (decarboxylating) subunit CbiE [Desulfarculaceae bacterium]
MTFGAADKEKIYVVGMGMSKEDLTGRHLAVIRSGEILIGGRRHLDLFDDTRVEKILITKDMERLFLQIRENLGKKRMVVLASGDPLHFGIGSTLIRTFGKDRVEIVPNITTLQAAFSRIKERWDDAAWVSFHGKKDTKALLKTLAFNDKVAVYTDPVNSPARVAKILLERGMACFHMTVLSDLGEKNEKVRQVSVEQAAAEEFDTPNIVILKKSAEQTRSLPLELGMPDDRFEHKDGLITKAEVRSVTLSKLRLKNDHIFWDLGAGSGSVSVEAAVFITAGQIFAVEQNEERVRQIETNRERFGVRNMTVIRAALPEGMDSLPVPDRVFIGGGGKVLPEILQAAIDGSKPGTRIVVNTVLVGSMAKASEILEKNEWKPEITQISVSRGKRMPSDMRLEALNPVWIITGERPAKKQEGKNR